MFDQLQAKAAVLVAKEVVFECMSTSTFISHGSWGGGCTPFSGL